MATAFIPTQLRSLTGGEAEIAVDGRNVREVIARLDERFPGIAERLINDGRLVPSLQVTIDNQLSQRGLLAKVGAESEVHFLPAIGGG